MFFFIYKTMLVPSMISRT